MGRREEAEPAETLVDVMEGRNVPFEALGEMFSIRQPTTEEYDDALSLQGLVLRRTLALPEVAALAEDPPSAGEVAAYRAMIAAAEREFEEADEGSAKKDALAAEVSRLEGLLKRRTLADEVAGDRAVLARDRWLTIRLLCDGEGRQVFDPNAKDLKARFNALPLGVKDAARPAIWRALALVRSAPFSWEAVRGRRSG